VTTRTPGRAEEPSRRPVAPYPTPWANSERTASGPLFQTCSWGPIGAQTSENEAWRKRLEIHDATGFPVAKPLPATRPDPPPEHREVWGTRGPGFESGRPDYEEVAAKTHVLA
jgi:hypothetical protein